MQGKGHKMGGNRSHCVQVVICEYPYVIRKHLIPPFGDLPLSEVTEGRLKESASSTKIPSLLRGLNAIRTHFQTTGKAFFEHNHEYFPQFIRKSGQWRVINGPEGRQHRNRQSICPLNLKNNWIERRLATSRIQFLRVSLFCFITQR